MLLNETWNVYREVSEEDEELKYSGLVKFFMNHPHPTNDQIEELADELNISPNDVEERLFGLLSALLKKIGKHNDVPDTSFNAEQLKKGIDIEKEHTNDPLVAKMIAKDHLAEIPDYYSRLDDMENQARKHKFSIRDEI